MQMYGLRWNLSKYREITKMEAKTICRRHFSTGRWTNCGACTKTLKWHAEKHRITGKKKIYEDWIYGYTICLQCANLFPGNVLFVPSQKARCAFYIFPIHSPRAPWLGVSKYARTMNRGERALKTVIFRCIQTYNY